MDVTLCEQAVKSPIERDLFLARAEHLNHGIGVSECPLAEVLWVSSRPEAAG